MHRPRGTATSALLSWRPRNPQPAGAPHHPLPYDAPMPAGAPTSPRAPRPSGPPFAQPPTDTARRDRLRRAWLAHPVVAFLRHRSLITFYRQLHAIIRAGIPLPSAFAQLDRFAPDERTRRGLGSVARDVRAGTTLAEALRRHGALFEDANVELLGLAEEAGRLEPVLATLIAHLEQVQRQRWEAVLGALWPLYLVAALVFVGPLLGAAQALKPGASLGALYASGLVRNLGTAALVLGALLGAPLLIAALGLQVAWDRLVRRLPLVSAPLRRLAASRFVLGLGLANESGLEVVKSLRLAVKAAGSAAALEALPGAELALRQGATLTDAVATLDLLDRASLGSLAVAETTGTLSETLERLSRELQEASVRATRLLLLVVLGLAAAVVVVKIVLGILGTLLGPIKTLYDAAGSGSMDG
jgi:type IV pilus assembly protein PilC